MLLSSGPELEQRTVVVSGKTLAGKWPAGQHEQALGTLAAGGHQEGPRGAMACESLSCPPPAPPGLLLGQSQLLTPCADYRKPTSVSAPSHLKGWLPLEPLRRVPANCI